MDIGGKVSVFWVTYQKIGRIEVVNNGVYLIAINFSTKHSRFFRDSSVIVKISIWFRVKKIFSDVNKIVIEFVDNDSTISNKLSIQLNVKM